MKLGGSLSLPVAPADAWALIVNGSTETVLVRAVEKIRVKTTFAAPP